MRQQLDFSEIPILSLNFHPRLKFNEFHSYDFLVWFQCWWNMLTCGRFRLLGHFIHTRVSGVITPDHSDDCRSCSYEFSIEGCDA